MPSRLALVGLPRISEPSTLAQTRTVALTIPLTSGGMLGTQLGIGGISTPSRTFPSSPLEGTSTSTLANLLPLAHPSLQRPAKGVYLGDGIPPVPEKIAAKIRKGEFIEMGELLPEFWSPRGDDSDLGRNKVRRSHKVTDIFTWL